MRRGGDASSFLMELTLFELILEFIAGIFFLFGLQVLCRGSSDFGNKVERRDGTNAATPSNREVDTQQRCYSVHLVRNRIGFSICRFYANMVSDATL